MVWLLLVVGLYLQAIQHAEAVGNLVIVGGSLQANNSYIYGKIIEWAVSIAIIS